MQDIATRVHHGVKRIEAGPDGGIRMELTGLVRFPPGYEGAKHNHAFWELVFICSGKGHLDCDGSVRACNSDALILLGPNQEHHFKAGLSWPLEMLYLGFTFDIPEGFRPPLSPVFLTEGPGTEWIRTELRDLLPAVRKCERSDALKAAGVRFLPAVSRVAGLLQAGDLSGEPVIIGPYDTLVRKVKEYLHANIAGNVTVPEMARRFHLSSPYFGEVFKRQTGMSMKEYHRNLRLLRALDLLRKTDRPVSAIASEVGMDDIAYFSRSFKRRFGISPRQARKPPPGDVIA